MLFFATLCLFLVRKSILKKNTRRSIGSSSYLHILLEDRSLFSRATIRPEANEKLTCLMMPPVAATASSLLSLKLIRTDPRARELDLTRAHPSLPRASLPNSQYRVLPAPTTISFTLHRISRGHYIIFKNAVHVDSCGKNTIELNQVFMGVAPKN